MATVQDVIDLLNAEYTQMTNLGDCDYAQHGGVQLKWAGPEYHWFEIFKLYTLEDLRDSWKLYSEEVDLSDIFSSGAVYKIQRENLPAARLSEMRFADWTKAPAKYAGVSNEFGFVEDLNLRDIPPGLIVKAMVRIVEAAIDFSSHPHSEWPLPDGVDRLDFEATEFCENTVEPALKRIGLDLG